jgi:O-Antigen ligase
MNTTVSKKPFLNFLSSMRRVVFFAPLPFIALAVYMGLNSSTIFGIDYIDRFLPWHASYVGWYDYMLALSIVATYLIRGYRQDNDTTLFICLIAFFITISFIANYYESDTEALIDAYIYLLRFAFLYTFGIWLVKRVGVETAENFTIFLFFILVTTSLFVLKLQYGTFNRLYCSGMTVASFSQVAAVVCFISLYRKRFLVFSGSLLALMLTFSRTSTLLFLVCLFFIFFNSKEHSKKIRLFYLLMVVVVMGAVVYMLIESENYARILIASVDREELSTLHDRTAVWSSGIALLVEGEIPLYGRGFNSSPSLLQNEFAHFHNIVLEYMTGLGVFSTLILFLLIKRVWQMFKASCYISFLIYFFFFFSQFLDFTLYRPKEVIIWSFVLGLAEGQWRLLKSHDVSKIKSRQETARNRSATDSSASLSTRVY